jgi:hypothetical protein
MTSLLVKESRPLVGCVRGRGREKQEGAVAEEEGVRA